MDVGAAFFRLLLFSGWVEIPSTSVIPLTPLANISSSLIESFSTLGDFFSFPVNTITTLSDIPASLSIFAASLAAIFSSLPTFSLPLSVSSSTFSMFSSAGKMIAKQRQHCTHLPGKHYYTKKGHLNRGSLSYLIRNNSYFRYLSSQLKKTRCHRIPSCACNTQ